MDLLGGPLATTAGFFGGVTGATLWGFAGTAGALALLAGWLVEASAAGCKTCCGALLVTAGAVTLLAGWLLKEAAACCKTC